MGVAHSIEQHIHGERNRAWGALTFAKFGFVGQQVLQILKKRRRLAPKHRQFFVDVL